MSKIIKYPLTEICELQGGSQPPKDQWNEFKLDNYVRMLQIRDFTKGDSKYIQFVKDEKKLKKCKEEDILIARYGASVGKILTGLEGAYNVALMKIIPTEKLNREYLYHYLKGNIFQNALSSISNRAAQAGFNKEDLQKIEIPLPTLTKQKEIASVLDKAQELISLRKESIKKLDELSKSIFIDMFGDPISNPKKYQILKLEEISNKITDGEHGTVDRIDKGKRYLMARNISSESEIDLSNVSYISESIHTKIYKRCNPEYNDLLLVCVGATIGKCALVPKIEEFSLARSVALIKPNLQVIHPLFLLNCFKTEYLKREMKNSSNSSAQAGLYLGAIKNLNIPLPPMELQNKFAKIIEKIEEQKSLYEEELKKLEENFNALLQKSFK